MQVGADGALLEWYDERPPREPGHRHLSHLYGLYPGTRITSDFAPAAAALRTRLRHGSGHTGWSRARILCLAARLRDPELAAECIDALLDELCSPSLLTLHPDAARPTGRIFQIDGNLGAVAGITELLVQSHGGVVRLLPALPAGWDGGAVRGIRCRGGHTVALTWSARRLVSATLVAGSDGPLVVELPTGTVRLVARAGAAYRLENMPTS